MKKIAILAILISVGTLINSANQPQQSKMTAQQFQEQLEQRIKLFGLKDASKELDELEKLDVKRQNLEKQIPQEIKEAIENREQELLENMTLEIAGDAKEFSRFVLEFDLKQAYHECKKNGEAACQNKATNHNKAVDALKESLTKHAEAKVTIATLSVQEQLMKEFSLHYPIYKKLQDTEAKLLQHIRRMQGK